MQSQDAAPRPLPAPVVDVEQAEAALVEHYPRLVRLAYLVLPHGPARTRRVLTAHALVQRALPRARTSPVPAQGRGAAEDPGYAYLRQQVVRAALEADRPLWRSVLPTRTQLPTLLPRVWGLRLFPRSGGADELALDQELAALSGPARAAYVLRGLERMTDADVRRVLTAAGVADPLDALEEADELPPRDGLLGSPEFDPCWLRVRPTDLVRRRLHTRAALAGALAVAMCGALLVLPGDGWGPDGPAAPPYAQNPAAEAALDPEQLVGVPDGVWRTSARTDFSVWPARGSLTKDKALLRRALAVWARPGSTVQVSATPGTQSGAPAGPPQLLYAGETAMARVVVLYDGLRLARYAEPRKGTSGAAIDFARVDGATGPSAAAVVLDRVDGNVRYLTAPWVKGAAVRDLAKPTAGTTPLALSEEGVTDAFPSPAMRPGACRSWNVVELTDGSGVRLVTDLGELAPAHLTAGRPRTPREVTGPAMLGAWSPYACSLGALRGQGVRAVNAWRFARQPLPDGSGTGTWVCTRAETWRGGGAQVLAQFAPAGEEFGAVTAKSGNSPACGPREPHVLAGVMWKSAAGDWYMLAAGGRGTRSITATGGVEGTARGSVLALRAEQGATAGLSGELADGRTLTDLR